MTFAKKTEILSKHCARCTRSRDFLKCPETDPCREYVELSHDLNELIAEVADSAPEPFTVTSMEDYCRQFEQWKKKIKEEKK